MTRRNLLSAVLCALCVLCVEPALAEDVLRLFNWNNYITEASVKAFEERCKCRLAQDYYADNEEMLAKLAAGATGYDLIVPTGNAVETLIAAGKLQKLDKARLANFGNVKPEFTGQWFDPGNDYSVPYAYSLTILGYNGEKLAELGLPTDTWALVFEPKHLEKLKGKVTVLDSQRELFAAALIYLGHSPNETDEAKLKQARDLIVRAKPYWAAFNAGSYFKELAVGNIWVALGYSNDMYTAREDAKKAGRKFSIGYSTPLEGAVFALDNLVMPKGARRPDLAYRFIDFWLEGEAPADITNAIGAGNANSAAMQWVKPEVAANRDLFPDAARMKRLHSLKDHDRKTRRLLNRLWVEIKVR
jgi:spermidine/putrescine transport system substrate-binding protein